jgi:hypothetical protein
MNKPLPPHVGHRCSPAVQATKLELTTNLKTAKALSLGVPLLGPADELIEKGAMSASGPKQKSLVAPTCPLSDVKRT